MQRLYKITLIIYLAFLLWLILFKFSANPFEVLAGFQSRSFNFTLFAGTMREMIENFAIFVPLGLLVSMNLSHIDMWRRIICIGIFSISLEALQYALAIGMTDATDVITNTLGGFVGLAAYDLLGRYVNREVLNKIVVVSLLLMLGAFVMLRIFVFKVRYA